MAPCYSQSAQCMHYVTIPCYLRCDSTAAGTTAKMMCEHGSTSGCYITLRSFTVVIDTTRADVTHAPCVGTKTMVEATVSSR